MVKVTGYQLREAIRRTALDRDTSFASFKASQTAFPGEVKEPTKAMEAYLEAEEKLARLQAAQDQYNLTVKADDGQTLAFIVNFIGGLGRSAKGWREMATPKVDRYSFHSEATRSTTDIVAAPTLDRDTVVRQAKLIDKTFSHYRALVGTLNNVQLEIEGLSPADLD